MTYPQRLAPLAAEERSERQQQLIDDVGSDFDIFATLVRHPELFADFEVLAGRLLRRSGLPGRVRETLIMRTARRCLAGYEWAHHAVIGRREGLTDQELAAIGDVSATGTLDETGALLVRAADELVLDHRLGDASWRALQATFDEQQIIEICLLVGNYAMIAGVLNSLGVQIEDGFDAPAWSQQ